MVSVGEGGLIGGDISMESDKERCRCRAPSNGREARDDQIALRAVSFPGLTGFSCRSMYS